MSKRTIFTVLLCLAIGMGFSGCAQFDRVAIEKSREYATVEEQVEYLLGEADTLLNMEKFDSAINVAEYILESLDPNSVEAKGIIETAKAGLEKAAQYRARYYRYNYYGIGRHRFHGHRFHSFCD